MAKKDEKSQRKPLMIIGVGINLLFLGYYKYADFFINNVNLVSGSSFPLPHIILPLAISFFTFQQVAFLVDIYQDKKQLPNPVDYCLFVSFFPQLIAGPIVHHKVVVPQFKAFITEKKKLNFTLLATGMFVFFLGLFKKVVIADALSEYANPIFNGVINNGDALTLLEAWAGALFYTFQLYFDFSGYSDMAIGIALMFGIRIPINFNSPYKAKSIVDFWRRWHITLSTFLRDYLYIPLGGNRYGFIRKEINLMITMLLGGLWHGAGWSFVVWGGLHGFYLMVNHCWILLTKDSNNGLIKTLAFPVKVFSLPLTFILVVIAWVFFRAEDINAASSIIYSMFNFSNFVLPSLWDSTYTTDLLSKLGNVEVLPHLNSLRQLIWIAIAMVVAFYFPNSNEIQKKFEDYINNFNVSRLIVPLAGSLITMCLFLAILNGSKLNNEFIYFNF